MTLPDALSKSLVPQGVTFARVNWSRIIVDCPKCDSALRVDPDERYFRCWDCGAGADIVWPPNLEDIIRVLVLRPEPKTRNWAPPETIHDLLRENMIHGHMGELPELGTSGSSPLVLLSGDRIVRGVPQIGG